MIMASMKEKVDLSYKNGVYLVMGLVNRTEPCIGKVLETGDVDELILEAKRRGKLTVSIR